MITIQFDFRNRRAEDLVQLNALLAAMELRDLQLKDSDGYLATTTDGEGNLISYRYGLDSGTLICVPAEDGAGYRYQIDSLVADNSVAHEEVLQLWRKNHPDRAIRIVIRSGFDHVSGYIIMHHQRID